MTETVQEQTAGARILEGWLTSEHGDEDIDDDGNTIRDWFDSYADLAKADLEKRIDAEVQRLQAELAQAKQENERLKDALHEDKTGLAAAIAEMVRLAKARCWILDGRGLYEWDDDEYRKEAGYALLEVIEYGRKALNDSGNLAHGEDGCRPKRFVPVAERDRALAVVKAAREQVRWISVPELAAAVVAFDAAQEDTA